MFMCVCMCACVCRCIDSYIHVGKSEENVSAGHRILELPRALAALACVFLMSSEVMGK